jgi:hypothetical protein
VSADGVGDGEKMHKEDGTQGVCSSWLGGDDVFDVFCFGSALNLYN